MYTKRVAASLGKEAATLFYLVMMLIFSGEMPVVS